MKETVVKLAVPRAACPRCGCREFCIKSRVSGNVYTHYNMDGTLSDNTDMWDTVKDHPYKTAYCSNCNKSLGKVEITSE